MNRREIVVLWAHKRKNRLRTPGKSGAVKVFMGIVYGVLLLELLGLGISSNSLITKIYPDENPVTVVNSLLLYWFLIEVLIRFAIQSLPVMDIVPYLPLPISKSSLIKFLQIKGLSRPANYLSLVFFLPFALSTAGRFPSTAAMLLWLMTILIIIWLAAMCALHIKRSEVVRPASSFLFLALMAGLGVADFYGWPFSLKEISGYLFNGLFGYPVFILIPIALLAVMIGVNDRFMHAHMYLDEAMRKKETRIEMRGSLLGKYFGLTGALMDLDIKLAWRNKRTRSQVYMMGLFLLYPFIFYTSPHLSGTLFFLCMVGIFVSGMPMLIYGQMPFDSAYFEGMMSRIRIYDYVKARYTLFVASAAVVYVLTLPYAFYGVKVFTMNTVCLLYNMGVSPVLLLHLAASNRKRVDLSQSSTMNMQGISFMQVAVVMVLLFIPGTVAAIFGSVWPVAILGILGIISYQWQLKWVTDNFTKQKYKILAGFRKR